MKANDQASQRFLRPVVALLFLIGAVLTAMPSSPTWAEPPDPQIPQPEPFFVRLEQPLTRSGVTVEPLPAPTQITTDSDDRWNNLMAQNFDGDTFPPGGWELRFDAGWQRISGDPVRTMDTASAGITNTTTLAGSWLVYGPIALPAAIEIANAKLEFSYWLDSEKDQGWFGWVASSDGQSFYGARVSGQVGAWLTGVLDMRQYIGDDSVWVAFFFEGDGAGSGVYVDNVTLQGFESYLSYFPIAAQNYEPPPTTFIYTDDFDDVDSGWRHKVKWGSTDEQKRYVQGYTDKLIDDYPSDYSVIGGDCRKGGRYFMRVGSADYGAKVIAKAPVQAGSEFTLEADIAFCDNASFASAGLLFGLNDDETEYYRVILIYDTGGSIKYAIWQDDSTILKNTSSSDHLKWDKNGYGKNTVKIVRSGCQFSVYFNDHKEWSTDKECDYTDQRWVGLFHDKYPGTALTGVTADDFYIDGALEPLE